MSRLNQAKARNQLARDAKSSRLIRKLEGLGVTVIFDEAQRLNSFRLIATPRRASEYSPRRHEAVSRHVQ